MTTNLTFRSAVARSPLAAGTPWADVVLYHREWQRIERAQRSTGIAANASTGVTPELEAYRTVMAASHARITRARSYRDAIDDVLRADGFLLWTSELDSLERAFRNAPVPSPAEVEAARALIESR